eukprot:1846757-Prymnesium_polylepis.1
MATQKVSEKDGGKPQEDLFLGLALVHPPGEPDKCGVLGLWVHNAASIQLYYSKYHPRPPFAREEDSKWLDKLWIDLVPLMLFDPGVIVYVGRPATGLSTMDKSKNVFVLNGTMGENEQQRIGFS